MAEQAPTTRLPRALRPFASGQYRLLTSALSVLAAQSRDLAGGVGLAGHRARRTAIGPVHRRGRLSVWDWCCRCWWAARWRTGCRSDSSCWRSRSSVGWCFGTAAVLSLTGLIQVWHLALIGLVLGVADGFFYPAYSAWLPAIIPPEQLLAANGIEGMLRPTIMQAVGPGPGQCADRGLVPRCGVPGGGSAPGRLGRCTGHDADNRGPAGCRPVPAPDGGRDHRHP